MAHEIKLYGFGPTRARLGAGPAGGHAVKAKRSDLHTQLCSRPPRASKQHHGF